MSAILGGDPDEVLATLERHGLTAANRNGGGQIVAAGTLEQLATLAAEPPAKTRIVPLQVAGAFHTAHMAPAVERLAGYARAMTTREAHTRLISNRDGHVVRSGREVLDRLVSQVSAPVRWAVSNTHLEGYKRQGRSRSHRQAGAGRGGSDRREPRGRRRR